MTANDSVDSIFDQHVFKLRPKMACHSAVEPVWPDDIHWPVNAKNDPWGAAAVNAGKMLYQPAVLHAAKAQRVLRRDSDEVHAAKVIGIPEWRILAVFWPAPAAAHYSWITVAMEMYILPSVHSSVQDEGNKHVKGLKHRCTHVTDSKKLVPQTALAHPVCGMVKRLASATPHSPPLSRLNSPHLGRNGRRPEGSCCDAPL
jgi:hypothetical protein